MLHTCRLPEPGLRLTRGLASWRALRKFFSATASQKRSRLQRRFRRLVLESLEDRTLPSASVLGSVWNDLVPDGKRVAGEPGLAGVTVTLNQGGNAQQTVTNGSGNYSFTGLAAGSYSVAVIVPAGGSLTTAGSTTVQVSSGQTEVDFGVQISPASLPNTDVTNDASTQQTPSIAVDPRPGHSNHLVMAYMDYGLKSNGFAGIGVQVSEDGGQTWSAESVVPILSSYNMAAGSPVVQFDAQGHFTVAYMAATFLGTDSHGNPLLPGVIYDNSSVVVDGKTVNARTFGMQANNGVFVVQGQDDGFGNITWGTPSSVASNIYSGTQVNFETLPDLAIDTNATLTNGQPNPHYGYLYVTWTRFYAPGQFPGISTAAGGSDTMLAVSADGGLNWTTQLQSQTRNGQTVQVTTVLDPLVGDSPLSAGRGNSGGPSRVTVGPNGGVYVSEYAGGNFPVFYSTDAGATFTTPDPFVTGDYYAFANIAVAFPANGTLANDTFRTLSVRDIVADPSRPGYLYAVEAIPAEDASGNLLGDAADIYFQYSTDYGQTWTWGAPYTVGSNTDAQVLNDDNGNQMATGLATDVMAGQALPQMAVDAQGDVTVIWYDTRRDPNGQYLDVYGTTSTDGGQTFSPNYRITTQAFDPSVDAKVMSNGFETSIGERLGLASAGGNVYAAWTDALTGHENIYFASYTVSPAPVPLADRFDPASTPATATDLGQVSVQLLEPKLSLTPGQDDWFQVTAAATGTLSVTATAPLDGSVLQVQLWNSSGTTELAAGQALIQNGQIVGSGFDFPSVSGTDYLIRVTGGLVPSYELSLQSLTEDLGTTVQGTINDTLAANAVAVYRLITPVNGSLAVNLTGTGLTLQVLSADGQTTLAQGSSTSVVVTAGQVVLLEVSGASADTTYELQFINLDEFETSQPSSLFFPVAGATAGIAAGSLTGSTHDDLVVTNNQTADTASVLLSNGDGTFRAAQQYAVGVGDALPSQVVNRPPVLADLTGNGILDMIVPNYNSDDVSVLMGLGNGTFGPQREFDAGVQPDSVVVGDFNGDGIPDLAVLSHTSGQATLSILMGRGDGTFLPPKIIDLPVIGFTFPVLVGDLTGNGRDDLVFAGANTGTFTVLLSNGDGTFTAGGTYSVGESILSAQLADVNGDGKLDMIVGGANSGTVYVFAGDGHGGFQAPVAVPVLPPTTAGGNVGIFSIAVADFGSAPNPTTGAIGAPDGIPDLIVVAGLRSDLTNPQVYFLPGLGSGQFGSPVSLATLSQPGQLVTGQFSDSGGTDIAVTDTGGVRVIYGTPPTIATNATAATARDLGTVTHYVSQPQAIVNGHTDAYFALTVPTEATPGAGTQVVDFSALFSDVQGTGLQMQVLDAATQTVLASGSHVRIEAAQGQRLLVRVFGLPASGALAQGAGVYTLDIAVLPQVVGIVANSLLPGVGGQPGGPINSLLITLQGADLDPTAAENPANYTVTYIGPPGTPNKVIPLSSGAHPVVYSTQADVQVASGLAYPTAVEQTITLLFDQALPVGSYEIDLSPNLQVAAYSSSEASLLTASGDLDGHPMVSVGLGLSDGSKNVEAGLVQPAGAVGSLQGLSGGSPFLNQWQSSLSALLDQSLANHIDDATITSQLTQQTAQLFAGAGSPGHLATSFLVVWLDPVGFDMVDPNSKNVSYNANSNNVSNDVAKTFVEVGGNVEVMVVANASGLFSLNVSDVPPTARGGAVILTDSGVQTVALTEGLQGGQQQFVLDVPTESGTTVASSSGASGSGTSSTASALAALLLGLTAEGFGSGQGTSVTATSESGGESTGASFLASTSQLVSTGGSGEDQTASNLTNLIDAVFRQMPLALKAEGDYLSGLFGAMDASSRDIQATMRSVWKSMGGKDWLPDVPVQPLASGLVDWIMETGAEVYQKLGNGGQIKPKNAPKRAAPAPQTQLQDVPADGLPQAGSVRAEQPEEMPGASTAVMVAERTSWEGADKLKGAVVAAVFAAGAWQGVWSAPSVWRIMRRKRVRSREAEKRAD